MKRSANRKGREEIEKNVIEGEKRMVSISRMVVNITIEVMINKPTTISELNMMIMIKKDVNIGVVIVRETIVKFNKETIMRATVMVLIKTMEDKMGVYLLEDANIKLVVNVTT